MRAISLALASALALATIPAIAQQAPPLGASPGAPAAAPRQPARNPLTSEDVSDIKGTAVYGNDEKKIGSVSTVLMKPDSKTIDRLVVGSGGVLGVGAHEVAIPLDQFSWDADKGGLKLAKTSDDLKSMAEWKSPSSTTASGSSQPPTTTPASPPAR